MDMLFLLGLSQHWEYRSQLSAGFDLTELLFHELAGLKLGGNERGGNWSNDATNLKISSIIP